MITGIYIMGILQGVALSIILFRVQSPPRSSNRLLGIFVMWLTLLILGQFLVLMDWHPKVPLLFLVSTSTPLLIGPTLYLYFKSRLGTDTPSSKGAVLHFLPSFAYLVLVAVLTMVYHQGSVRGFVVGSTQPIDHSEQFPVLGTLKTLHLFIYLLLSIRLLIRNRNKVSFRSLRMLLWFSITSQVVFGLFLIIQIQLADHAFTFIQLLGLYLIGYQGLWDSSMLKGTRQKYAQTNLNLENAEKHFLTLERYMQTSKPFLQPELNLKTLAASLGLSENQLSQVINQIGKCRFLDYVNSYRVEEAKLRISSGQYEHQTLLAIAYDVGFSNKNSFNKYFKKNTGFTPSQYKKSNPLP